MPRRPRFRLTFAPEALEHLDAIEPKYHRIIRRIIDEQLRYSPETATRNRKLLEQPAPFEATWELRFGPDNRFRVFYEVYREQNVAWILAIGIKVGNQLFIAGEEIKT
jgi:mRNA-degrading endonuclease RelE of RelBE toxin-antitoxin system